MINKIKWLTWSLFIITVSYSLYYSFIKYNNKLTVTENISKQENDSNLDKNINNSTDTKREEKILAENLISLNNFTNESSLNNQKKFVSEVDTLLNNSNLSNETKETLLFRKAVVLSVVRGDNSNRNETIDILKKFIETTSNDELSLYRKDYALITFIHMSFQCCAIRPFSEEFPDIFNKYRNIGHGEYMSQLFTLNELASMVSNERKDDITLVSNSILVEAQIIDLGTTTINKQEKIKLMDDLNNNLNLFKTAKPKILKDGLSINLEPLILYAYGYDIYNSNIKNTVDAKTNKSIDSTYVDATNKINKSLVQNSDEVAIKLMVLYNSVRYLKSIDRRYADNVDITKRNNLINDILILIKSNPDVKRIADSYFKQDRLNPAMNFGYFKHLAKTNVKIADYMKSIGIKIEDIQ